MFFREFFLEKNKSPPWHTPRRALNSSVRSYLMVEHQVTKISRATNSCRFHQWLVPELYFHRKMILVQAPKW